MSIALVDAAFAVPVPLARKSVLLALSNHADERGRCWPPQTLLAEEASLSERAVRDQVHALRDDGWLTVVCLGNGAGKSTEYRLNVPRMAAAKAEADARHAQEKAEAASKKAEREAAFDWEKAEADAQKAEPHAQKAEPASAQPSDPTVSTTVSDPDNARGRTNEPIPFPALEDIPLDVDPVADMLVRRGIALTAAVRDGLEDYQRRGIPDAWLLWTIRAHPDKPWNYLTRCIETTIRNGGPQEVNHDGRNDRRRVEAADGRGGPRHARQPGDYSRPDRYNGAYDLRRLAALHAGAAG